MNNGKGEWMCSSRRCKNPLRPDRKHTGSRGSFLCVECYAEYKEEKRIIAASWPVRPFGGGACLCKEDDEGGGNCTNEEHAAVTK